jgi:hypothetical protein
VFGSALTLFVIPAIYVLFHRTRAAVSRAPAVATEPAVVPTLPELKTN